MPVKRIFLIVLDSFGIGALPDAEAFGDKGSNTLAAVCLSENLKIPNLLSLGLADIDGVNCIQYSHRPIGAYGRFAEKSAGKDTVTGHREICGLIADSPMPYYPNGFPQNIIAEIESQTGIGTLCNKPYSGTDVIRDYGSEQLRTGKMIVYTSADSVFQAAAHEDVFTQKQLYEYCEKARKILRGKNAVGRVIARPFSGKYPDFVRIAGRHDYTVPPSAPTLLDSIKESGLDCISVGKIYDIFAGHGLTEQHPTTSNDDGMAQTDKIAERDFHGLCFVNLVDFDSKYGHRNDTDGYASALSSFDSWLGGFIRRMKKDDVLMITADHGCDPSFPGTDHTREYIPILVYGDSITPKNIGTGKTYADIGKTISDMLGIKSGIAGSSFSEMISKKPENSAETTDVLGLIKSACTAMERAYSPYSGCKVGAALLAESGKIYTGCNIENASFGATICAERSAFSAAVSAGEREFTAIAIVGKSPADNDDFFYPCGICRQVMSEFCRDNFEIITAKTDMTYEIHTLNGLLPSSFGKNNVK